VPKLKKNRKIKVGEFKSKRNRQLMASDLARETEYDPLTGYRMGYKATGLQARTDLPVADSAHRETWYLRQPKALGIPLPSANDDVPPKISEDEAAFVESLQSAHGFDFDAMSDDLSINHFQLTPGELRKAFIKYFQAMRADPVARPIADALLDQVRGTATAAAAVEVACQGGRDHVQFHINKPGLVGAAVLGAGVLTGAQASAESEGEGEASSSDCSGSVATNASSIDDADLEFVDHVEASDNSAEFDAAMAEDMDESSFVEPSGSDDILSGEELKAFVARAKRDAGLPGAVAPAPAVAPAAHKKHRRREAAVADAVSAEALTRAVRSASEHRHRRRVRRHRH
jgi:hypothetical protein